MIKGLRNGCLQGVTDLISHYDMEVDQWISHYAVACFGKVIPAQNVEDFCQM